MRYRFRGCHPQAFDTFVARGAVAVVAGGERRRTEGGVTVGWWDDGRAYVEGRLAAILNGPDDHSLRPAYELVDGALVAEEIAGAQSAEVTAVGRADLTGELYFPDRREGRRFLAALASVDVPWLKTGTEGAKRAGLETVYWRTVTGRSVILRAYDKGVETGQAAPGQWVRFERQRRWRKERELDPGTLAELDMREQFVGRELAHMIAAAPELHLVGTPGHGVAELRRRVAAGEIPAVKAARLVGYLTLGPELFLDGTDAGTRYVARAEAELRQYGIAVNYDQDELQAVAVAPRLRELAERWAA